jgi:phage gpG-like protein
MRLSKFVLVCGVVALMAAPALAQPGRGGFGPPSNAQLLQNKSVQEEMKLDKDTITKITDALKKVQDDESLKDARQTVRDRQASQEDRAAARKKIDEANTKALSGILKADQEKRLTQIRHFTMGLAVFTNEETAKDLKLTDDQKEKIKEISDNFRKDAQEIFGAGGKPGGKPDPEKFAENQKKVQTLQKEAMASATKTLKADQKTTLKELIGESFDYKPEFNFGGKPGGKPGDKPTKPRNDF